MSSASAIIRDPRAWAQDIAFTAGAAIVLAVLAPFGSFDLPFGERLLRNVLYGFASFAFLWQPMRIALHMSERVRAPKLLVLAVGLAILTVPVTLICGLVARSLDLEAGTHFFLSAYPLIVSIVLPFGMVYLLVENRLTGFSAAQPLPRRLAPAPTGNSAPRLLSRLSVGRGGAIMAVEAEDHYVRVHTERGATMVLMRLSDAILEMDGVAGHRVHRSWWVATSAIEDVIPNGRRLQLKLTNGLGVPVTREASARLRRTLEP